MTLKDTKPRTLGEVAEQAWFRAHALHTSIAAIMADVAEAVRAEVLARLIAQGEPLTMDAHFEKWCRTNDTKLVSAEVRMIFAELDAQRAQLRRAPRACRCGDGGAARRARGAHRRRRGLRRRSGYACTGRCATPGRTRRRRGEGGAASTLSSPKPAKRPGGGT